jgi:hypothetical protein
MGVSQVSGQRTRVEWRQNQDLWLDAGSSLDDDLVMPGHTKNRNRLSHLTLSGVMLLGTAILVCGCAKEDQKTLDLTSETKAIENTTNKIGNAINAIGSSFSMLDEGRPPIMQADLEIFWMNVTSTRLGLGRFLREMDATPELQNLGRNLWIGRIQGSFDQAETAGVFKADGQVALKLGETFGKERVVEELRKIESQMNEIRTRFSIQNGTASTGG